MVADRKRRGGLWASEWKWDGVAAPGLGTSRTEAACKAASTDSRHKDKLHLKYHHRLTVFTHEASEMGMSIDKCATSVCGMLARPHPFLGLKKSTLPLIRPPCFHKFPWQGSAEVCCPHNPSTALLSNTLTLIYSKLQT